MKYSEKTTACRENLMKKALVVVMALFLALAGSACRPGTEKAASGTISISGAWALYPMVVKWAEEFQKVNPNIRIDVQAGGAGKGMTDALAGMADFGMVSREVHLEEAAKGAFVVAVTKDAVVATVSSKNPLLPDILKKGFERRQFVDIWIGGKITTWGEALGTAAKEALHVFTRSDACGAADTWAAYLGKKQEDLGGVGVYGDPGLADAVRRDPLGIGYNNVNFAYDAKTLRPVDGIAIIPIDLDSSGTIEDAERIYDTRDSLTQAIARGVYPSPPARDLYLVSKGKPVKEASIEFLRWVLVEGQAFVPETGYIRLSEEKLKEGLEKLK
jgi:phosphate transport system substrate-binding protein